MPGVRETGETAMTDEEALEGIKLAARLGWRRLGSREWAGGLAGVPRDVMGREGAIAWLKENDPQAYVRLAEAEQELEELKR